VTGPKYNGIDSVTVGKPYSSNVVGTRELAVALICIAVSAYPYPSAVEEPGATGFQYHLMKQVKCDEIYSLLTKGHAGEGDTSTNI